MSPSSVYWKGSGWWCDSYLGQLTTRLVSWVELLESHQAHALSVRNAVNETLVLLVLGKGLPLLYDAALTDSGSPGSLSERNASKLQGPENIYNMSTGSHLKCNLTCAGLHCSQCKVWCRLEHNLGLGIFHPLPHVIHQPPLWATQICNFADTNPSSLVSLWAGWEGLGSGLRC